MPLDKALGIAPYQQSSEELVRLGCLLSVMMPYAQASEVLRQLSGDNYLGKGRQLLVRC